ncbi:hypothetical protein OG948_60530 (plasmid) [Embleya sp. NBC_00888]|uniref:hypothetical protein n=1 Tax=Embleya sp. NBC_00888 TaxID=2975960 RepID=UPI002F91850A|nr:hypothetical protein OG948_60530 [Embleya sp. NBC_00888]
MKESERDAVHASLILANKEPLEICDTLEIAQGMRKVYVRMLSKSERARTHAVIIHRPFENRGGWHLLLLKLTSASTVPLRICYSFTEAQDLLDSYARNLTREGRGASHAVIIRKLEGDWKLWGIFEFKRSNSEES